MPSYAVSLPQQRMSIVDTLTRTATQGSKVVIEREIERAYRSRSISQFHTNRVRMYQWIEALESIREIADDWNSYGSPAPSESAVADARQILGYLADSALAPDTLKASAEGGIAIIFTGAGRNRAIVETLNNHEQYALLYDLDGRSRTIDWSTGTDSNFVIGELKRHLRGSLLAA